MFMGNVKNNNIGRMTALTRPKTNAVMSAAYQPVTSIPDKY